MTEMDCFSMSQHSIRSGLDFPGLESSAFLIDSTVTVEASDDLRHWQPAGDAQLLKVSYNGSTLSQDRIELDGTRARYLRLRWLDGSPYIESIDEHEVVVTTYRGNKIVYPQPRERD